MPEELVSRAHTGLIPSEPAARKRIAGGILLCGLAALAGYFFLYEPVHSALKTGVLRYSVKGVMLPPACLYLAGILFFTDITDGDGKLRALNASGKLAYTKRGWWVIAGAVLTIGLTLAGWFWYLRALGVHES